MADEHVLYFYFPKMKYTKDYQNKRYNWKYIDDLMKDIKGGRKINFDSLGLIQQLHLCYSAWPEQNVFDKLKNL